MRSWHARSGSWYEGNQAADAGRPAFEIRVLLAATLAASYGIYSGFELCENVAIRSDSEEYLDSEKYEIKVRDWNQPGNITPLITRINKIRRAHTAFRQNRTLAFHTSDNLAILWFSKHVPGDGVLVAVNPGFPFLPAPDGPFIHPKAAAPTRSFFIAPSSRF